MFESLFKTTGEPMSNDKLGMTVGSCICSILVVMLIMKMPVKPPPVLAVCALSCCCSSSQTSSLVNDIQKRVKKMSESSENTEEDTA